MKLRTLGNKVFPVVIVGVPTFITLSTSVMAVNKILGSLGYGTDWEGRSLTESVRNNRTQTNSYGL